MKSNLLKSIFISLILVMGVGSMNAANTMRIYCKNTQSWWKSDNAAVGAYYWGTGGNANSWPGTRMTKVSGQTDLWYIDVDIDKYQNIIFTRVPGSGTVSDWGAKTGDLTISNTKNQYTITQSSGAWNGATSAGSWGTYKPTSTAALTASPASVYVGEDVTLTPSLSSNTDANTYSSTSYSVSPATASVTCNTFTATAADTYTVTATVTYYPLGCPTLTSTATAKTTITVTQPTYSYTVTAGEGGKVTPTSGTVAQGNGVTITATPDDGYEFNKWTATNGTLANANSASTTFTPSANNAKATASFKLAGCTQTPTTPTSLTAKVGGNALVGEVCSGTNVTLTAGGTISVGSLQWGTGTVGENIIDAENGRSSITVSLAATTTYWVRSIITEAGVCYGVTSDAKTLQVSITPALVQPVLSKSTLTLEEGGSTGSITVTSGTTGGTWTSSDQNVATVNNGTVTSIGPGTATITYTVSNACEADKTATCTVTVTAKPYYIAGRLQQNWNTSSTTQQFTYVSNGQYKYETDKTVAELSAQWQDNDYKADQYFFIHAGEGKAGTSTYPFWTTKNEDGSGHNFEAHIGESNAIELGRQETNWNEIVENRLMKFTDVTDNSSDVVIWWEPSTNKLWYTATANLNTNYYLLGFGNSNWDIKDARRFVKDENDPTKAKVTINLAEGEYT